jgi:hypothetical protein
MSDPLEIRRIVLPNALQLLFHDDSRGYFGDYHLVRVLLSLSIPLESRFFASDEELLAAQRLLPDPLMYRRSAERMGVPSANVVEIRTVLVDDLLSNAGGYLASQQFPAQFIRSELKKARSGKGRTCEIPVFRGA